jgi:hypothetical protein
MSGPITVVITSNPVTALLAASAITAAEAVRAGYEKADQLADQQAASDKANRQAQSSAMQQGNAALAQSISEAEGRWNHLIEMARGIGLEQQVQGLSLVKPDGKDLRDLHGYLAGLLVLVKDLETIVLAQVARQHSKQIELPTDLALPQARQSLVERLLERVAHLGEIPQNIDHLARELAASPPGQQAEILTTELRRAIQLRLENAEKEQVERATSVIVGQTLKDLGYQVEEIGQTLFVEGGVAHFRRSGWGDYMVRMRVDAKSGGLNFNVIRAVEAGNNVRSKQDHIAEDRWCAEFPALLKALQARGVQLDVTRRLAAGELPVQLVDRKSLPNFVEESASRSTQQGFARKIP